MGKILFLITGINYAGAENQLVQLCRGFRAKGCQVAVVSMIKPAAYLDELEELQVEVHSLDMRKGIPDPRAILRLRRLITRFRPDVVHSHLVHANLLARITRLFVRMPLLVCTAHSMNEGGRLRELLYRVTDPLCDLTTNVSRQAVQRYRERRIVPGRKLRFMPNGIDAGRFGPGAGTVHIREELSLARDTFIWFAAGRFVPEKDYANMLAAFAKTARRYPDSVLLIAGAGPEREAMEELSRTLQVEERVKFLGLRRDIPQLMNEADAYLMSSRWEGLPMVLLEASASGLPIVATDVGGNKEVVQDGRTGLLSVPGDSRQLSERMTEMMFYSPEERERMGRAGRKFVEEQFDMGLVIDRWISIYEQRAKTPEVLA